MNQKGLESLHTEKNKDNSKDKWNLLDLARQ